jgi:AcrR family transcriptional regulator
MYYGAVAPVGRPRSISDARIFDAVAAVVGRDGPDRVTFAAVAREAGVSTGALTARHGTKRALLLAFVRASTGPDGFTARMRAAHDAAGDPLDGIVASVAAAAGAERSPEEFANHLAFLHLELADPEFRAVLADHDAAVRAELRAQVVAALAAGVLAGADPDALAAALDALLSGTQIAWAMRREGTLADALRRDAGTLLAGYGRPA